MSLCCLEADPLTPFAAAASGTIAPVSCRHHSAGEHHLMAQGYRMSQLPCLLDIHCFSGQFGGHGCLYVPSTARQNNNAIHANVVRRAKWKLNLLSTEAALWWSITQLRVLWVTRRPSENEAVQLEILEPGKVCLHLMAFCLWCYFFLTGSLRLLKWMCTMYYILILKPAWSQWSFLNSNVSRVRSLGEMSVKWQQVVVRS